ncbi:MAG: hypothetical protein WB987_14750 [Candidatus Acidiferrales bacterium]
MSTWNHAGTELRPRIREVLVYALRYRCPNCHRGPIFAGRFNRVLVRCPECGLAYFREAGYFVGGMILTYGFTVGVLILAYLLMPLVPTVTWLSENMKYAAWIGSSLLLAALFVRPAYALWLSLDYWLEPWAPPRLK